MPSGRTHDSITLWSLPLIAGLTFARTQSSSLTLCVSSSYLFSGLMFGPDLDVYSHQYKRWGLLRWIWLPYRRSMRHRSFWSHGPLVGTIVRIAYLLIWVGLFSAVGILTGAIVAQFTGITNDGTSLAQQWCSTSLGSIGHLPQQYPTEAIAIAIGLELGAMSHALADWALSTYRRTLKQRFPKNAAVPRQSTLPPVLSPFEGNATTPSTLSERSSKPTAIPPTHCEPQLPPFERRKEER